MVWVCRVVDGGLGPGEGGVAGDGWGVRGAVVEVAEEEEVGWGLEEGGRGGLVGGGGGFGEEGFGFWVGGCVGGLGFGFKDEVLAYAFPVLVSSLPVGFHRC